MKKPFKLLAAIGTNIRHEASPPLEAMIQAIQARLGDSVSAILYYGSCLRTGNELEGLMDLYVLVDSYSHAFHGKRLPAISNALLPPNVYLMEVPYQGTIIRAKYAVISLDDFERGASRWFHSYIWGRFCQPCALVYCRSCSHERRILNSLASAVISFAEAVTPCMNEFFTSEEFWRKGLRLSYGAELRSEGPGRAENLYYTYPAYFDSLLTAAAPYISLKHYNLPLNQKVKKHGNTSQQNFFQQPSRRKRAWCKKLWIVRAVLGKLLSLLRLGKAAFTFRGGIDYILWKVERHSGVQVEASPALRRFPPVAAVVLAWRLYSKGGFR